MKAKTDVCSFVQVCADACRRAQQLDMKAKQRSMRWTRVDRHGQLARCDRLSKLRQSTLLSKHCSANCKRLLRLPHNSPVDTPIVALRV